MKKRYVFFLLPVSVVLAITFSSVRNHASVTIDSLGRPALAVCHETVYGRFDGHGGVVSTDGSNRRCSENLRPISSNYVARGDSVYWISREVNEEAPCITGTGDPGGVFYNLSWACLTAVPRQVNEVEERRMYLTARYSPAFHSLEGTDSHRPDWQRDQLADYASDATSVYYRDQKIVGAEPGRFSVIFPFGDGKKWRRYAVSKSGNAEFVGGKAIGSVDLLQFQQLIPVPCPGHGISGCTIFTYETPDIFFEDGNWGGILGKIGSDIVFLQTDGINRFPRKVSSDTFMFATTKRIYLYSQGKFLELVNDAPYPTDDVEYPTKKFVDMNVVYFEQNP